MANTVISLKKSATPSATPSALANGELAINYADGKLFYKAANGTIVEFASGGGAESSDFGTVNVGGTLLVSDIQGDILTITAGDNIVLTPDAGGDSFSIAADLSGATDYANSTFLANTTGSVFNGDLAVSGNLAVGTTTTTNFKLEVNGSFAATTKSFVIDHPTKDGKRLRYASLEGPENGVYVRGKLKGDNVIELPDYWTGLVDEDSITVNLTPIGSSQNLFVKEVKDNKVFVKSTSKTKPINCYYIVYAERKDVDKLEVEI
jgi:hypothetical protein